MILLIKYSLLLIFVSFHSVSGFAFSVEENFFSQIFFWEENNVHHSVEGQFTEESESVENIVSHEEKGDSKQIYIQFIQNIHEWHLHEQSAQTISRVLDIHEKYQIPVDLYFDDQVLQEYVTYHADLLERIKYSPVASVSWHIRPPYFAYTGFDFDKSLNDEELYDLFYEYETHKLDIETGEILDEPGGYQLMKEVIGYAPKAVGLATNISIRDIQAQVYKDLGAQFAAVNKEFIGEDGKQEYGLTVRPQTEELKIYEYYKNDGQEVIDAFLQVVDEQNTGDETIWINLKYHENDYFLRSTTWSDMYYESINENKTPKNPPYTLDDLSYKHWPENIQEQKWISYEVMVQYIADHADIYSAVNLSDIENIFDL